MAGRRDPWVRWFDVTSPKKHSGGFTIYKVTSKVFPVHSPEATTEIVAWKRYKDINRLHKTLYILHRNLHRPGIFPDFPKPRIFGRFDDEIIEERRLAALELLNFIGSQPHLFNSLAVQEFFETTESTDGEKPDQNILQPVNLAPAVDTEEELDTTDTSAGEELRENTEGGEPLEPDTSEGEERRLTTSEGEGLRSGTNVEQEGKYGESAEEGVNEAGVLSHDCIDVPVTLRIDNSSNDGTPVHLPSSGGLVEALSGVWAHRHSDNTDSEPSDIEDAGNTTTDLSTNQIKPRFQIGEPELGTRSDIMDEFDPFRESSSPRQAGSTSNAELLSECIDHSAEDSVDGLPPQEDSSLTPPSDTLGEYVQNKEDYLYKAVKQIRRALREEKVAHYQIAFDYYKRAVALLLTGVQGDDDEGRRSVVKRKTAEYLLYAEQLHNKYLDSSGTDGDRWRQLQVPRHVARLRSGLSELANYKVLGLIGGNMLVSDKRSDETFVIKVLQKNSEVTESAWARQIIPTKSTHMIKLVRYFETESTIYLLLEYAQGGTLWQYVYNYLHGRDEEAGELDLQLTDGAENIYSGKKYTTTEGEVTQPLVDANSQVPQSISDVTEDRGEVLADDSCNLLHSDMSRGNVDNSQSTESDDCKPATESDDGKPATESDDGKPATESDDGKPASYAHDSGEGNSLPQSTNASGDTAECVAPANRTTDTSGNGDILKQSDDVFKNGSSAADESPVTTKGPSETSSTRRNSLSSKVSLRRSNSSMSRSISVERGSDSVNAANHRHWSTAFDDLNVSSNRKHTRPHLPESCAQRWAAELLVAINELHLEGLLLRDLRPANILLNSRGHVILTYFCRWPGVHQDVPTKSVERLHISPEGTFPGALCLASDYWSFGVVLYELLAGVSLASAHPEGITSHTILRTPDHLSAEAEHLLKQLLRYNWRERLGGGAAGIDEIKAHPFFNNIDWNTL